MPTPHTDSHIVEVHEDGSWTETNVTHHEPVTKAQKASAIAILAGVCFAPFVPLVGVIVSEKMQERRNKRRLKLVPEEETTD